MSWEWGCEVGGSVRSYESRSGDDEGGSDVYRWIGLNRDFDTSSTVEVGKSVFGRCGTVRSYGACVDDDGDSDGHRCVSEGHGMNPRWWDMIPRTFGRCVCSYGRNEVDLTQPMTEVNSDRPFIHHPTVLPVRKQKLVNLPWGYPREYLSKRQCQVSKNFYLHEILINERM